MKLAFFLFPAKFKYVNFHYTYFSDSFIKLFNQRIYCNTQFFGKQGERGRSFSIEYIHFYLWTK